MYRWRSSSINSKASSHLTTNSRQPSNRSGPIYRSTSRRKKSMISSSSRMLYNRLIRRSWLLLSNGRRSLSPRVVIRMHLISRRLRQWLGWWQRPWIIWQTCLGSFRLSRRVSCLLKESIIGEIVYVSYVWGSYVSCEYVWWFGTGLGLCYQIVPTNKKRTQWSLYIPKKHVICGISIFTIMYNIVSLSIHTDYSEPNILRATAANRSTPS